MLYTPILLKINAQAIKAHEGANYLLQIWKLGGKKVFEKPLQSKHLRLSYHM